MSINLNLNEGMTAINALLNEHGRKTRELQQVEQQVQGQRAREGKLSRDQKIRLYESAHDLSLELKFLEIAIEKLKKQTQHEACQNLPPIFSFFAHITK